jgi:DNA-binding MarR family transcriptional regulator
VKTNVAVTSIKTYHDLRGVLGEWEWRVYLAIRKHPNLTRREIADLLGTDSSSVAGRVHPMVESGLVVEHREGTVCSITGKRAGRLMASRDLQGKLEA